MSYSTLTSSSDKSFSNNSKFYTAPHILKGSYGEIKARDYFVNLGYSVDPHKVTEPGVDIHASKGNEEIVAEVLNWYGGYIHPKRFHSIVNNLIKYPNAKKILICFGVRLLKYQAPLLKAYGISFIYDTEGVITSITCSTISNKYEYYTIKKSSRVSILYWFGRALQAVWTKPGVLLSTLRNNSMHLQIEQ